MTRSLAPTTSLLRLDVFAQRCDLHPDLVHRFVTLGLIEPTARADGHLWFATTQVRRVDKMMRLRSDLGLNYGAVGLILDLLDRIDQLERAPSRPEPDPIQD